LIDDRHDPAGNQIPLRIETDWNDRLDIENILRLSHLLPAKRKVRKVVHHAALSYAELPTFMQVLRGESSPSARVLEFLILTASRTSEALGVVWSEIDLRRRLWTRYDGSVDFACASDAQSMLINQDIQLAGTDAK